MLRALLWTLVILVLPVVLLCFIQRPLAATLCPACVGLERLQDGVYVESAMPAAERHRLLQRLAGAEADVARFYGAEQHVPRVLACSGDACYRHLGGGGTRVGSLGDSTLMVSSEGADEVLLSHELSHVELHGRVGVWRMFVGDVPTWFDEGVAVLVSNDPVYLAPPNPRYKDRCRAAPDADLPDDPAAWRDQLQEDPALYAKAACRVDLWMLAQGGPAAVPALLAKVAGGQDFSAVFGK